MSNNYHTPEFIYPDVEVRHEDLQCAKQETAVAEDDDDDVIQWLLKVRF